MQTRSCRNRWTGSCEINLDRFLFIMPSCVCQKIRSRVASSPAAAPVPCLARCGLQPLLPSPADGLPCSVSLPAEPSVRAPLVFPSPAPQMLTATSLFSATSSPFEIPRAFFRRRKAVSVQAVAGYGRGLRLEAQSEPRRKAAWFRGAHRRPAALHGLLNMPCQRCTQARGTAWRQEAGAQNVIARAWRPTKDAASCLPRPPVSAGASGRAHVFPSLSSSKRDVPGQASTPGRGNPLGSRRDDCSIDGELLAVPQVADLHFNVHISVAGVAGHWGLAAQTCQHPSRRQRSGWECTRCGDMWRGPHGGDVAAVAAGR